MGEEPNEVSALVKLIGKVDALEQRLAAVEAWIRDEDTVRTERAERRG
jgi:hypothetical protein